MVGLTLNRCALALVVAATLANAVDPSPEIRKKWDDKCKASESCSNRYMVNQSDANEYCNRIGSAVLCVWPSSITF